MDHLLIPHNAVRSDDLKVLYVCKAQYDKGPFLEYPARTEQQFPMFQTANLKDIYLRPYRYENMPIEEVQIFLQTWLFFGLLQEFLDDSFCENDFIARSDQIEGPHYVTTAKLPHFCEQWVKKISSLDRETALESIRHIQDCLATVISVLRVISCEVHELFQFNSNIRKSFAAIGELLDGATRLAIKSFGFDNSLNTRNNRWQHYICTSLEMEKMVLKGWCRNQVHQIFESDASFALIFFYTQMERFEGLGQHDNCSKNACRVSQHSDLNYTTQHCKPDCACEDLILDSYQQGLVFDCLDSGSFALLKISVSENEEEINLEVVPARAEIPFVAISHVWAQGLGNPINNGLPQCQIARLSRLVKNLGRHIDEQQNLPLNAHFSGSCVNWGIRHGPKTIVKRGASGYDHDCCLEFRNSLLQAPFEQCFIWIDTLCCPLRPHKMRKAMLRKLTDVYNDASAVLVLDASLEMYNSGTMDPLEMAARIAVSTWTTRLWTLQESTLALRIFFQYKKFAIDFYYVWFLAANDRSSITRYAMRISLDERFRLLKLREFDQFDRSWMGIQDTTRAVKLRYVSKQQDEPFCLATLLNVDPKTILDAEESAFRMVAFWNLMDKRGDIPASVIFHTAQRIAIKGYRWAPSTFLNPPGTEESTVSFRVETQLATLCDSGLSVEYAAFKFRIPAIHRKLYDLHLRKEAKPGNATLYVRADIKIWYAVRIERSGLMAAEHPKKLIDYLESNERACICILERDIMRSLRHKAGHQYGVMGQLRQTSTASTTFESHAIASVYMYDEYQSLVRDLAHYCAQQVREHPAASEFLALNNAELVNERDKFDLAHSKFIEICISTVHAVVNTASDPNYGATMSFIQEKNMILGLVFEFFYGFYGEVETFFPGNTKWIVD